jgi:hypothetical protein
MKILNTHFTTEIVDAFDDIYFIIIILLPLKENMQRNKEDDIIYKCMEGF